MHIFTYIHIYSHTHIYIYMHIHIYIYIYTYIHISIYIYIRSTTPPPHHRGGRGTSLLYIHTPSYYEHLLTTTIPHNPPTHPQGEAGNIAPVYPYPFLLLTTTHYYGTRVTFAPERGSHSPLNQKGSHSPLNHNTFNVVLNALGLNLGTRGHLGELGNL